VLSFILLRSLVFKRRSSEKLRSTPACAGGLHHGSRNLLLRLRNVPAQGVAGSFQQFARATKVPNLCPQSTNLKVSGGLCCAQAENSFFKLRQSVKEVAGAGCLKGSLPDRHQVRGKKSEVTIRSLPAGLGWDRTRSGPPDASWKQQYAESE
jgi:hypothetical protein